MLPLLSRGHPVPSGSASTHPTSPQVWVLTCILTSLWRALATYFLLTSTSLSSKWAEKYGTEAAQKKQEPAVWVQVHTVQPWARLFSLGPGNEEGGAHPACCVSSKGHGHGEVQRQPWREKLSKVSSPTIPRRGRFLLVWESGAWAWLCDLEQRPSLLWPVFPSARWEWKGAGPYFSGSLSHWPPLTPPGPLPISFGCFGCEASVAAPPCPWSPAPPAVLLSSSLFLPLSLTTPISASSFLLSSRFLLSSLCLWTPAPARPGSHSDGCKERVTGGWPTHSAQDRRATSPATMWRPLTLSRPK
ncbi:Hypothetical predicted protein, partial [Lynx pardinus]